MDQLKFYKDSQILHGFELNTLSQIVSKRRGVLRTHLNK